MKVKNILGPTTYNLPKGFNSWTAYWQKKKKKIQLVINCPACNTTTRQEKVETAHVNEANTKNNKEYIVPVCDSCVHRDGIFTINSKLLLQLD